MLPCKLTAASVAICAFSAVSAQVTETPVTLPAGSTPAGTDFKISLVSNNASANPDAAFYSTQIFFTNYSSTDLLYTNDPKPIPIASGTFSPGFKNGAWNETTLEFTPLNETRYCTLRPGNSEASFSYDTSTWSPGSYDLHVRTIVFKGEANGVEASSTDPNRVELCISAPFTNVTTETIARFGISAAGSGQPNVSLGSTQVTLRMATQPASATAGAPTATPAGTTGGAARRILVTSSAAILAGAAWCMGAAFQY